jgi:hypothetical protein
MGDRLVEQPDSIGIWCTNRKQTPDHIRHTQVNTPTPGHANVLGHSCRRATQIGDKTAVMETATSRPSGHGRIQHRCLTTFAFFDATMEAAVRHPAQFALKVERIAIDRDRINVFENMGQAELTQLRHSVWLQQFANDAIGLCQVLLYQQDLATCSAARTKRAPHVDRYPYDA